MAGLMIHYSHTYKNKLNGLAKILRYYCRDKANYNELFRFLFFPFLTTLSRQ